MNKQISPNEFCTRLPRKYLMNIIIHDCTTNQSAHFPLTTWMKSWEQKISQSLVWLHSSQSPYFIHNDTRKSRKHRTEQKKKKSRTISGGKGKIQRCLIDLMYGVEYSINFHSVAPDSSPSKVAWYNRTYYRYVREWFVIYYCNIN